MTEVCLKVQKMQKQMLFLLYHHRVVICSPESQNIGEGVKLGEIVKQLSRSAFEFAKIKKNNTKKVKKFLFCFNAVI